MLDERRQLGCKQELTVRRRIVEWLLAHAVARENQALRLRVPERECEHAVQSLQEVETPLVVCVCRNFAVGFGAEAMAAGAQLLRQLAIVVDLTIDRHRGRTAR